MKKDFDIMELREAFVIPEKVVERNERLKKPQLYYIPRRIFKYLARYREKE